MLLKWLLVFGLCWGFAFIGYITVDKVFPLEEYKEEITGVPVITTVVENGTTWAYFDRDGTYHQTGYTRPNGGNMLMWLPTSLALLPFIMLIMMWRDKRTEDKEDDNMANS